MSSVELAPQHKNAELRHDFGLGKRAPQQRNVGGTEQKQTHLAHGGVCSSVLDTNPSGVGGGSGRGGGGSRKFLSILEAFLNSPFHSEHFEYTQVG